MLGRIVEWGWSGFLIWQPCRAIVVQGFARWSVVESVDPFGSLLVQESEHLGQTFRRVFVARRVSDEMIVIRENRPRFQLPAEFRSDPEQAAMQNGQPPFARKSMLP